MKRAVQMYLLNLGLLIVAGCSAQQEHSMFVSARERDAFNDSQLQALSDEQDMAGGLIVYFDTDSSAVDEGYIAKLSYVANELVTHPDVQVFIEGHADEQGAPEQNVVLGQARADMIAYYLLKYGALYDQVNMTSYGERYPVNSDNQALNRRAVIEWASQTTATLEDF